MEIINWSKTEIKRYENLHPQLLQLSKEHFVPEFLDAVNIVQNNMEKSVDTTSCNINLFKFEQIY